MDERDVVVEIVLVVAFVNEDLDRLVAAALAQVGGARKHRHALGRDLRAVLHHAVGGGQHPVGRDQAAAAELAVALRLDAVVEHVRIEQRHLKRPLVLVGLLAAEHAVILGLLGRGLGAGRRHALQRRQFGPRVLLLGEDGPRRRNGRCGDGNRGNRADPLCNRHVVLLRQGCRSSAFGRIRRAYLKTRARSGERPFCRRQYWAICGN